MPFVSTTSQYAYAMIALKSFPPKPSDILINILRSIRAHPKITIGTLVNGV